MHLQMHSQSWNINDSILDLFICARIFLPYSTTGRTSGIHIHSVRVCTVCVHVQRAGILWRTVYKGQSLESSKGRVCQAGKGGGGSEAGCARLCGRREELHKITQTKLNTERGQMSLYPLDTRTLACSQERKGWGSRRNQAKGPLACRSHFFISLVSELNNKQPLQKPSSRIRIRGWALDSEVSL